MTKPKSFIQLENFLNHEDEESDEEDIEMEEAIEDFDEAEDADSESSDDEWTSALHYFISNHCFWYPLNLRVITYYLRIKFISKLLYYSISILLYFFL